MLVLHVGRRARFTFLRSARVPYTRAVSYISFHKLYPQLSSGRNVSLRLRRLGRFVSARNGRSNCRFARSTTYTRPTDVSSLSLSTLDRQKFEFIGVLRTPVSLFFRENFSTQRVLESFHLYLGFEISDTSRSRKFREFFVI